MKPLKLSKTSLLILLAGIFIVVAAGLGLTRSQQIQAQGQLDEELSVAEKRLDRLQTTQLRQQREELQKQVDESEMQLAAIKDRLRQSIESIDVTDEFYAIAQSCGVEVSSISSTDIKTDKLKDVNCSVITVNAVVKGEVSNLISLVISLNNDFTTGVVKSAQMSIPEETGNDKPLTNIQMIVHAYEGD